MTVTMQQLVETQLSLVDKISGPLMRVTKAAEAAAAKLENTGHASGAGAKAAHGWLGKLEHAYQALIPVAGAAGAALGFASIVHSTEDYIKKLKEVRELTGATASETDFLFSSARKAGVEYGDMQRILFQLSRKGSMLEQTMAAAANKVPGMAQKFARMGVTMDKGPVAALASMSDAVKKGKLDAGDLMAQFRIPPSQVNDFKGFLERLDKSKLKMAKGGGLGLVGDETVDAFNAMEDAQHRIADGWQRIQLAVGKHLMPVMSKLVGRIADGLENRWIPAAEKFGEILAENAEKLMMAGKLFVAAMTSRKVIDLLSTAATDKKGVLGKLAIGGPAKALGEHAGMGAKLASVVSTLTRAVPALAGIGAAAGLLYLGYKRVQDNVDGVKDRLMRTWDSITARFELMGETFSGLWQRVSGMFGGGDGSLTAFLGKVATMGFERIATGLDFAAHTAQTLVMTLGDLGGMFSTFWREVLAEPFKTYVVQPFTKGIRIVADSVSWLVNSIIELLNKVKAPLGGKAIDKVDLSTATFKDFFDTGAITDIWKRNWDKAAQQTAARAARNRLDSMVADAKASSASRREAGEQRPQPPHFDFRGSRFDITQNFAEGFDPDRIAVAFGHDLAQLGELKAQSGFAPLFAAH